MGKNRHPVTVDEINKVWGNADFGDLSREHVVRDSLLRHAAGYVPGGTARQILQELGLVTVKRNLTVRGRFMLFEYFKSTRCPRCLKYHTLYVCESCYKDLVIPKER